MVQGGRAAAVSITDPEEVRKFVMVRRPPRMSNGDFQRYEAEIIRMIAESGALLKGHFILDPDE